MTSSYVDFSFIPNPNSLNLDILSLYSSGTFSIGSPAYSSKIFFSLEYIHLAYKLLSSFCSSVMSSLFNLFPFSLNVPFIIFPLCISKNSITSSYVNFSFIPNPNFLNLAIFSLYSSGTFSIGSPVYSSKIFLSIVLLHLLYKFTSSFCSSVISSLFKIFPFSLNLPLIIFPLCVSKNSITFSYVNFSFIPNPNSLNLDILSLYSSGTFSIGFPAYSSKILFSLERFHLEYKFTSSFCSSVISPLLNCFPFSLNILFIIFPLCVSKNSITSS